MNSEILLRELIQVDTTNPNGNEMNLVKKILEFFPENINYKIFDHSNNRGSLIITIDGQLKDAIGFFGHIDTVPITDINSWKFDPFEGKLVDGLMYGRGTTDMKGGVASMIQTALYFIENDINPSYTLKFIFTADEESNGLGISSLKAQGALIDIVESFICEPSDKNLGISEKGALWLKIDVTGSAAHASKPNLGINAIHNLLDLINEFKSCIDFEKYDPLLGNSTFQITTITGGVKTNIIPDYASTTLDIRTIPGVNNNDLIDSLKEIISKKELDNKVKISFEIKNNRPSFSISENSEFIKRVSSVIPYNNFEYIGIDFYTDGSLFVPEMEIPFVIFGPGFIDLCHQVNEYTDISHIDLFSNIYIEYIKSRVSR